MDKDRPPPETIDEWKEAIQATEIVTPDLLS
jgi:hypothetical protein